MPACRSFSTLANAKNIDGRLNKKKGKSGRIGTNVMYFYEVFTVLHNTLMSQAIRIFLLYT